MIKVTNIAPGPRGLHTKDGHVMLAPGETAELDFEFDDPKRRDGEIASSKATGWFVFEGQSKKETDEAYAAMSDDELRELLKGKGVAADGRWGHDKLVSEVRKAVAAGEK